MKEQQKENNVSNTIKKQTELKLIEQKSKWKVLNDDYLISSKSKDSLKEWDKDVDSDLISSEDESQQQQIEDQEEEEEEVIVEYE